jgi:hypothetical protein
VVPRCGGVGDSSGGDWGGSGIVSMVEEERDDVVPRGGVEGWADDMVHRRGDGVDVIGVVAVWTRRRPSENPLVRV